MSAGSSGLAWIVLAVALIVVVQQHLGYFRRKRPMSFGAFLETGGWIVLLLAALGALAGGLAHPGTRVIGIATGVVGLLLILLGSVFR